MKKIRGVPSEDTDCINSMSPSHQFFYKQYKDYEKDTSIEGILRQIKKL
jgi:hypothetical protein